MKRIILGATVTNTPATLHARSQAIDRLAFKFNYNFNPVVAFNSGSQGLYRRRYDVFEYPYTVSDVQASGIISHTLDSKMGSKAVADITIKDNPNTRYSAQLEAITGGVVYIDAPSLGTGSGQTFHYWKIIALDHEYSTNGFITRARLVSWSSGTLTAPNSNLIDFTLPLFNNPHPIQHPKLQSNTMWIGGVKSVLIPMSPTDNVV